MIFAILALPSPADLVVVNAQVWTDGKRQTHNFVAVRNGRFEYLGRRRKELIGPKTVILDAKGRVVTPGLIDSHTHMMESGVGLVTELPLREATSKASFIQLIKEWSNRLPAGKWVVGNGWSAESWPEKESPTKEWLDSVTGGRPAILHRMDGHSAVVNSEALRRANITAAGPKDPPGGVIDRDPTTGEPTGMLRERAVGLIQTPPASSEDRYLGFLAAVREANRWGITTVGDISGTAFIPHFRRYASGPAPSLRVGLFARVNDWPATIETMRKVKPTPGWFEPKGLKAYMDGSLGSRTAFMAAPFIQRLKGQAADWRGVPMPGAIDGTYRRGFAAAAQAKLQVIVHAIGDQANHDVLNLFATIPGIKSRRFRVEHVQHLLPSDVPRFRELGVIPSLQPYHKVDDGRYCEDVIGESRSRTSYAFRDLFRTGARVSFGSDFDVVTVNPFVGIAAAVTGRLENGKIWMPQQNITIDEALTAYTANAAYGLFMEKEVGRIAPGYRADFVVLDRSPFDRKTELAKVKPTHVFVEGRKVTVD